MRRLRPSGAVTYFELGSFVLTRQPYGPAEVVPGGIADVCWPV